jgi:hypothetical protein
MTHDTQERSTSRTCSTTNTSSPSTHARMLSQIISETAQTMIDELNDGPELTSGLRRLWDAKNNFVLQAFIDEGRLDDN